MPRNTPASLTRALGRRSVQIALAGAIAATPLVLGTGLAHADTDWDAVAQCESGGDWNTDTGNGFSGGLQFTPSTWRAFGGSGSPENASRSDQIAVAERVKAEQGMSAWPTCSKKTGETDRSPNSGSESSSSSGSSSDAEDAENDAASTPAPAASTPTRSTPAPSPSTAGMHTVAAGDTLSSIATRSGTTVSAVAQRNAIADPDSISPGQQLALH